MMSLNSHCCRLADKWTAHQCTQAGAIHVADIRQLQDDPLRFRDEPGTVVSMSSFGRKCPRHDAIQSTLDVYGSKPGFDLGPYPKSVSFYLFLSNLQSAGAGKSLEELSVHCSPATAIPILPH